MPHSGCSTSAAATRAGTAGGMRGSSPCKLITVASGPNPRARTTSAMRSVPDTCSAEVITTSAPNPAAAERMRASSVATITDAAPLARAQSQTHWINGRPATSRSGLPGRRLAPYLAGMITWKGTVLTIGASGSAGDRPLQAPVPPRATSSEYRRARRKQDDRDGTRARASPRSPRSAAAPCRSGTRAARAGAYPSSGPSPRRLAVRYTVHDDVEQCMRFARVETRVHGHIPMALVCRARAFYGIFLGHEHRQIIPEAHVLRSDARMIRERVSLDLDAVRPQ